MVFPKRGSASPPEKGRFRNLSQKKNVGKVTKGGRKNRGKIGDLLGGAFPVNPPRGNSNEEISVTAAESRGGRPGNAECGRMGDDQVTV